MKVLRRSFQLVQKVWSTKLFPKCYFHHVSAAEGIRSTVGKIAIPDQTIDEFLFDRINKWSNKTAVICAETGRSYTFDQYQSISETLAHALVAKLGLKKGDVIATLLPNIPEYLTIFLAAFRAGIIITTINSGYTSDEITRQMTDCSAKVLITVAQLHTVANETAQRFQKIKNPIQIITIKHEKTDATPEGTINFQELCDYSGPQCRLETSCPTDVTLLPYSSGTSGLPKGVQLSHRNVVANLCQLQHEKFKLNYDTTSSHQDTVPMMAPIFHAYGMIPIMFNMFSEGCKVIVLPKYRPDLYLNMLEKYSPHFTHVVPPTVNMLINNENAKRFHLKRVRTVVSAAAPLADLDVQRFLEKFGEQILMPQYYGLTETGPVTHAQRLDMELVPGSVGTTLPSVECKIVSVDNEVEILGPNQTGHFLLRGPNVMPGYHNNPKATEEAINKEGWFRSGDIGYYNHSGVFFITDRLKELIKVKGFQVAPAELEALIRDHPDVDDVAVTAVAHEEHGEAPKAFVVPRKNSNLTPEHIQEYVKVKAAKHKHLSGGVVFIDAVPKNPTGKILRRMLKNM